MSQTLHGNGNGHGSTTATFAPPKPRATGSREAYVTFKNTDGIETRGALGRMERHSVSFELYSPQTYLNASESLAEFKINFHGKMIYTGRAVVASLVNVGAKVVCEVTLDAAQWLNVDAELLLQRKGHVLEEFQTFLQGWQKIYLVAPEFKLVVADLHTFLHDLQLWLNQTELQIRTLPAASQPEIENNAILEIGKATTPALNKMFEKFEQAVEKIHPSSRAAHAAFAQQLLHPLLLCSPFLHRTFTKPLGYAGDYEMVNMLNRNPLEGSSMFAKIVNLWFWEQPPAEAHRNRLVFLERRIGEETMRMMRQRKKMRVFNFACGPAVEIQQFLRRSDVASHAEFLLADFNLETLEYTKDQFRAIRRFASLESVFRFQKKSVQQLLKESDKITAAAKDTSLQFDFVYCAGLFDYLSDRTCKELMNAFYNFVAPGGVLLVTNVDSSNPRRPTMDLIMEWHLIYRNAEDFATLCPDTASAEDCSIVADATGVNIFMEIRKPEHG